MRIAYIIKLFINEDLKLKERKGKERKGKERKGKERKGKERKGKERKGKEKASSNAKGYIQFPSYVRLRDFGVYYNVYYNYCFLLVL